MRLLFSQVLVCQDISAEAELQTPHRRPPTTPQVMALVPLATTVQQGAYRQFRVLLVAFATAQVQTNADWQLISPVLLTLTRLLAVFLLWKSSNWRSGVIFFSNSCVLGGVTMESCSTCPAGHYCSSEGLAKPSGPCAAGFYCPFDFSSTTPYAFLCPKVITSSQLVLV